MKRTLAVTIVFGILLTIVTRSASSGAIYQRPAISDVDPNAVVQQYCAGCHSDRTKSGNLSLEKFDAKAANANPEVAEKVIRKLRAGLMPPPGARRPEANQTLGLVETLEKAIDEAAVRNPNPGGRTFQRLNRAEYERAIKDLLGLEIRAENWLPLDQMMASFDNMADAQTLSPMLLEAYLNAASAISRMAIGDRNAPKIDETYTLSQYVSQNTWDHIEGAPYGTRGGIVVDHVFPADGEYSFRFTFHGSFGSAPGDNERLEDLEVSIDGERVALLLYDNLFDTAKKNGNGNLINAYSEVPMQTSRIFLRAGQRRVAAAFIKRGDGPYEDLIRPHDWSNAGGGFGGIGITSLPHLRDLIITGPYNITGISDTPTRQKIFTCRPTLPAEERPCAREIVSRLATEAYRRPLTANDLDDLMMFYDAGARKEGFEIGVRNALESVLASPYFALRLELEPGNVKPGDVYRISDVDLASRLSFFLWGTSPDDELQKLASQNQLSKPGELERQARRMLADARADVLSSRFAYQWLRLQDLYKVHPDWNLYPNLDENLAKAMERETELFFNNLVRENRSLLELFTADYTFVNERLARHYGFPNVAGNQFRRVNYPDTSRRGLLGHGSVLVLTSLANRTSPVLRGKWVMEVLLGTPPPPPPPNVPDLDQTAGAQEGKMLTTRQRLELHRANAVCNSCHKMMDPIGLALDNFDVTAKWRVRENGALLDTHGEFYDGTPVSTLAELVEVLMKRPVPLVRTFAQNLLAYALGRPVEYYDQPAVRAIVKEAEADNYRMRSFVLAVIKSNAFQMKRVDPAVTDNKAVGR